MNIMAGSLGGLLPSIKTQRLSVLSIVLNSVCNLSCRHCYLGVEAKSPALTREQWRMLVRSALSDLRPDAICFSGKEVFSLRESADVLFEAARLRDALQDDNGQRTRVGVITNGTLLERYRDEIQTSSLDWLDVSVDGPPEIHDGIRGRGAFAKLAANLPWLRASLGDRLWVASTLASTNVAQLPGMIEVMRGKYGIRGFSLGLYKPLAYTDQGLAFSNRDRTGVILRSLDALASLPSLPGTSVVIEFDEHEHELRERLVSEGLIASRGNIRTGLRSLGNGITLRLVSSDLRVGLWRAARITHDGLWLAAEDLVDASLYAERAAGRACDMGFDASRLYRAGLEHPRFRELHGEDASTLLARLASAA